LEALCVELDASLAGASPKPGKEEKDADMRVALPHKEQHEKCAGSQSLTRHSFKSIIVQESTANYY
jgi:hypothetical protein